MKVMIIGAPRSGTSMIAGLLHKCGLYMGKKLKPGKPANPKGFFENYTFASINRSLFRGNKGREMDDFNYSPDLLNRVGAFLSEWPKDKLCGWKNDKEKREFIKSYIRVGIDNLPYADGHIFTHYHNYFKDWEKELKKVTDFLGLKIPKDTSGIEEFIDKDLWRNRSRH